MSETLAFMRRLEDLKEGDLSCLRALAGKPLDGRLAGFDLFTGLWWPLRANSAAAPRRETSWLVAKLYGSFPLPLVEDGGELPAILGWCEPRDEHGQRRFRARFDRLLCSPLPTLEPHLRWALAVAAEAAKKRHVDGIDWVQLLDDLSIWDRVGALRRDRDVRDDWAEKYLSKANQF